MLDLQHTFLYENVTAVKNVIYVNREKLSKYIFFSLLQQQILLNHLITMLPF